MYMSSDLGQLLRKVLLWGIYVLELTTYSSCRILFAGAFWPYSEQTLVKGDEGIIQPVLSPWVFQFPVFLLSQGSHTE